MESEGSRKTKPARRVPPRGNLVELLAKANSLLDGPDSVTGLGSETGTSIYLRPRSAFHLVNSGAKEDDVLDAHASKGKQVTSTGKFVTTEKAVHQGHAMRKSFIFRVATLCATTGIAIAKGKHRA